METRIAALPTVSPQALGGVGQVSRNDKVLAKAHAMKVDKKIQIVEGVAVKATLKLSWSMGCWDRLT